MTTSEEVKRLYNEAGEMYKMGAYSDSANAYITAARMASELGNKLHASECLYNASIGMGKVARYKDMLTCATKAVKVAGNPKDNGENIAKMYFSIGYANLKIGLIDNAEYAFNASLRLFNALGDMDNELVCRAYWANVKYLKADTTTAIFMAKEVTTRLGNGGVMAREALGTAYLVLALCAGKGGVKLEDRDTYANMALSYAKSACGEESCVYGQSLFSIANEYFGSGEFTKAEVQYRKALPILIHYACYERAQFVASNLGKMCLKSLRYADAIVAFRCSLEMADKTNDEDSCLGVMTNLDLGDAYLGANKPSDALTHYSCAHDVLSHRNIREPLLTARIYMNKGKCNLQLEHYREAYNQAEMARNIYMNMGNGYATQRLDCLSTMASASQKMGFYDRAIDANNGKIALFTLMRDNSSKQLADTHYRLYELYSDIGDAEKAIASLEQVIRIDSVKHYYDRDKMAVLQSRMSTRYANARNYSKAISIALNEIAKADRTTYTGKKEYAHHALNLATWYENIGDIINAMKWYDEVMHVNNCDDDIKRKYALHATNLAQKYLDAGKSRDAMTMYKKAVEIAKECGDHSILERAYYDMGEIYDDRGETKSCYKYMLSAIHEAEETGNIGTLKYADAAAKVASYELRHGNSKEANAYAVMARGAYLANDKPYRVHDMEDLINEYFYAMER